MRLTILFLIRPLALAVLAATLVWLFYAFVAWDWTTSLGAINPGVRLLMAMFGIGGFVLTEIGSLHIYCYSEELRR